MRSWLGSKKLVLQPRLERVGKMLQATDMATLKQNTSRLMLLVFVAWRNLWRNPVRSLLTVSALAGGLAMMIAYASLVEGMVRQMVDLATDVSLGHIQVHRQAYIDDQDIYATLPWEIINTLENGIAGISTAPRLYAAGLAGAGDLSAGIMLKAVDPARENRVTSMLQHVRHGVLQLSPVVEEPGGEPVIYQVAVGAQLAKTLAVEPGTELVIVTQAADGSIGNGLFRVAGILKPIEPAFDRMGVLLSIDAYTSLMEIHNGFHELVIAVGDEAAIEMQQYLIRELLAGNPGVAADVAVRNWRQLVPEVSDMLNLSQAMIYVVGLIMVGLAALGMLNTMLMSIHERRHEFGILLSIGMGRFRLLRMVLLESLFLALVSAVLGSLAGIGLSCYLERYGIDFSAALPDGIDYAGIIFEAVWKGHLSPDIVVVSVILMVAIALLASLLPAWQIVRLKPVQVMQ